MAFESGVFILKDRDTLVEMKPGQFASEDDFQHLLERFPSLLAGDQIDANEPRRWVLIKREQAIPAEESGSGRWSVDHLFVDQDGVPTLVEVKRQSDTRIRREVVGQMLDYAANSIVYWPVGELRHEFESSCALRGVDPADALTASLGIPEAETDAFWERIKANLERGKIRLLFVADRIPPELKRIVEFLNKQMSPAEVLALELRQYVGEGLKTLVPMVFGQTEEAQQRKTGEARSPGRHWDRETVIGEIQQRHGPTIAQVANRIADWMEQNASRVWFGSGTRSGSMGTTFTVSEGGIYPFVLWTYGKLEIAFQWMQKPPFEAESNRRELLQRLNGIRGVAIPDSSVSKRPSLPLAIFEDPSRLEQLIGVLDWFAGRVREHSEMPQEARRTTV